MFDLLHEASGPSHLLIDAVASSGEVQADGSNTGGNPFDMIGVDLIGFGTARTGDHFFNIDG